MKKQILTFLVCTFFLFSGYYSEQDGGKYYYAFDRKVPLMVLKDKALISFQQPVNKEQIIAKLQSLAPGLKKEWRTSKTLVISASNEFVLKQVMDNLIKMDEVRTTQLMYRVTTGLEMGVGDEIAVKYKENVSQQQIVAIIQKYDLNMVKTTKIYSLLLVPKGADALQIANEIQESGLVVFSHPNFVVSPELYQDIPNDTYFNNQFYLHNTSQVLTDGHTGTNDADIDAPEAWTMTHGSNNIIIAVLDEGVSSNHPDLPNTRQIRLNGSNFADGDPNDPSPANNLNHGNSCAGIIAASINNNQGIAGIAPNCRIMPIRIFDSNEDGITPDLMADAIEFAVDNEANVLSNSWGYSSDNPNHIPMIVQAIQYAVNSGCVVVFASGNNAIHTQGQNGYVSFPSNVNIPGVITVGASDRFDQQADYSPTSNLGSLNNQIIDITAPSHRSYPPQFYQRIGLVGGIEGETLELWSIDIPGNTGYNPYPEFYVPGNLITRSINPPQVGEQLPNSGVNFNAYTGRFGGTSAACPQVAGVAALILSMNPSLTPMNVFNIITQAADNVGGYIYTGGRCNELGYGRLNACRAVTAVLSTIVSITGPSFVCSSGAQYTVNNLPQGCSINWEPVQYLQRISDQGSNPCTFSSIGNGASLIRATVTSDCGSITLEHTVWSGVPILNYIVGPDYGEPNTEYYYWTYPSIDWRSGPTYTWELYPSDGGSIYSTGNNTAEVTFYNPDYYRVIVQASNSCGSTYPEYLDVTVDYEWYTLSPNPASEEVTISTSESIVNTDKDDTVFSISVFNMYGVLQCKHIRSGKSFTIPVSNLQDGNYIVRIDNGKKIVAKQLIIKH